MPNSKDSHLIMDMLDNISAQLKKVITRQMLKLSMKLSDQIIEYNFGYFVVSGYLMPDSGDKEIAQIMLIFEESFQMKQTSL